MIKSEIVYNDMSAYEQTSFKHGLSFGLHLSVRLFKQVFVVGTEYFSLSDIYRRSALATHVIKI